jgi:hypothetical protein
VHPNPKPTTLGIPLGGQPDKTRHCAPAEADLEQLLVLPPW